MQKIRECCRKQRSLLAKGLAIWSVVVLWFVPSHLSAQDEIAYMTVIDPLITRQPLGTNGIVGGTASFSVIAEGTQPFTYQWYQDGVEVPGAVERVFTIEKLTTAHAGYYTVQVRNLDGSATSSAVPLSIRNVTFDAGFTPITNAFDFLSGYADGKIMVRGWFPTQDGWREAIGRLNGDGTADHSFSPASVRYPVFSLVIEPDGKILVGGNFTTLAGEPCNHLGRLNADGTLDRAFNPGLNGFVKALALQEDGKILVGGRFTEIGRQRRDNLARLHPDGTLDNLFQPGTSGEISTFAIQPDGKILAGGGFDILGGEPRASIGRLNRDGTVDLTFNPGASGFVGALQLQPDGKIVVGGKFSSLGGQPRSSLGRLNIDGTLDLTFTADISDWEDHEIFCLGLDTDGNILVTGDFSTLAGQPRDGLGRLNAEGRLDPVFYLNGRNYIESLIPEENGKIIVYGGFRSLGSERRALRLNNTASASQEFFRDGSGITWLRGGSSPEVSRTTFEHSVDGTNWTFLGNGHRIPGGWNVAGDAVSFQGIVRARGFLTGGWYNGSSWFVETLWDPLEIRLAVEREGSLLRLNWRGGQGPFQVEQSTDLSRPELWQSVGQAVATNSISIDAGSGTVFLRVRGQ